MILWAPSANYTTCNQKSDKCDLWLTDVAMASYKSAQEMGRKFADKSIYISIVWCSKTFWYCSWYFPDPLTHIQRQLLHLRWRAGPASCARQWITLSCLVPQQQWLPGGGPILCLRCLKCLCIWAQVTFPSPSLPISLFYPYDSVFHNLVVSVFTDLYLPYNLISLPHLLALFALFNAILH